MKYALVSDSPHSRLGMMVRKTKPLMRKHLRLWRFLNVRRESASRSDLLIIVPTFVTAGCFLTIVRYLEVKVLSAGVALLDLGAEGCVSLP